MNYLSRAKRKFKSIYIKNKYHIKGLKKADIGNKFKVCGSNFDISIGTYFICSENLVIDVTKNTITPKLIIGDHVFINRNVLINVCKQITIGNNCLIGPNVSFFDFNHNEKKDFSNKFISREIVIEKNVWIGAGSIILPGVTIKENAIIGAGSVVTSDVPSNVVYAGNPARYIRDIHN